MAKITDFIGKINSIIDCFSHKRCNDALSHPSRVRGLKSESISTSAKFDTVAPFAGAWIEMLTVASGSRKSKVAPFAGAWIEISVRFEKAVLTASHPSRVRGLK